MMKVLLPVAVLSLHSASHATDIRIRNNSAVDFENVVVGNKHYGSIKAGATSGYQYWERAYRYSNVSLWANSKEFKLQPIDYVGEAPLGDGNFTYSLTLGSGNFIQIRVHKDVK